MSNQMMEYEKKLDNSNNHQVYLVIVPFILMIVEVFLVPKQLGFERYTFRGMFILYFNIINFCMILFTALKNKSTYKKKKKYLFYFVFYFCFILLQYISSFITKENCVLRHYYFGLYITLILFGLSFYLLLNSFKELSISLVVIYCYFLIVLFLTWNILVKYNFVIKKIPRIAFTFLNPNYFACFHIGMWPLSILGGILIYNFYKEKNKIISLLGLILSSIIAILSLIPLYLTKSRGAMLGFYLGLICFFIPFCFNYFSQNKLTKKTRLIISFLIPFVFVILPILVFTFPLPFINKYFGRFVSTFHNLGFSLNDRFNPWSAGLIAFTKHPILGNGLCYFNQAAYKYIHKLYHLYTRSNNFTHAHNEYIEVLCDGGIVGFVFFVCLLVYILYNLIVFAYNNKYKQNYRFYCICVATGIINILIFQFFCLELRMPVSAIGFFGLLGIGICLISLSNDQLIDHQVLSTPVSNTISSKWKNSKLGIWFEQTLSKKELIWTFLILAIAIFSSYQFMNIYCQSQLNLRKAENYKQLKNALPYYNKALEIMPNDVLVYYRKRLKENNELKSKINNFKNDEQYFYETENLIRDVQFDLDQQHRLIEGYNKSWKSYAEFYYDCFSYYNNKFMATNKTFYKTLAYDYLKKSVEYRTETINRHFLFPDQHIKRFYGTLFLERNDKKYKKQDLSNYIFEYIQSKIYINYIKPNGIVHTKVIFNISDEKTNCRKYKNKYIFNINKNELTTMEQQIHDYKSSNKITQFLNTQISQMFDLNEFNNLVKSVKK